MTSRNGCFKQCCGTVSASLPISFLRQSPEGESLQLRIALQTYSRGQVMEIGQATLANLSEMVVPPGEYSSLLARY